MSGSGPIQRAGAGESFAEGIGNAVRAARQAVQATAERVASTSSPWRWSPTFASPKRRRDAATASGLAVWLGLSMHGAGGTEGEYDSLPDIDGARGRRVLPERRPGRRHRHARRHR
jgi:hypothetical protein